VQREQKQRKKFKKGKKIINTKQE